MSLGLSIVIPTYGRSDLVADLLESIADDAAGVTFAVEITLVDDSPAADAQLIGKVAAVHGARVLTGVSHVGEKRNLGLQQSAHDLILFLDSDVRIRRGTLQAHFNRLNEASPETAGCLGKVEFVGDRTYAWRVIESMQLTLPFSYPDVADLVPWGPTANLSFRREPFLLVGGFDGTLPRYGGEDVDIGLRLSDSGFLIVTAPDAVAEHAIETWSTWGQNLRRLWSFGLADYHLLVRHPGRSFVDFPTGPMLWIGQLLVLVALFYGHRVSVTVGLCAFGASLVSYPAVYSLVKRQRVERSQFFVHLLGPIIFWTMDLAKAFEALRQGRPTMVLRRIKFLDDLIVQDWHEIAASAWGLTGSALSFLLVLQLFS
ncbi:MAG: glycosyltransferase family 2 protein [Desulfuromonadaceae bacterium]